MNEYLMFKLKPMCDVLLRKPNLENAKKLFKELERYNENPERITKGAYDLILFPILMLVDELKVRYDGLP